MTHQTIYEIEVSHDGLNKYRHIKGRDKYIVEQKASAQLATWDEMWGKKLLQQAKFDQKKALIELKEEAIQSAKDASELAEKNISEHQSLLHATLNVDDTIDWETLIDHTKYPHQEPSLNDLKALPTKPNTHDSRYRVNLSLLDKIFKGLGNKKKRNAKDRLDADIIEWENETAKIKKENNKKQQFHSLQIKKFEKNKSDFVSNQRSNNNLIKQRKEAYLRCDPDAIYDYCEMVLANSNYPENFPQEWDLDYILDSKILIVDYSLPNISNMPTTKAIKFVASKNDFTETHITSSAINKLYDSVLHQISLRTVHELYEADVINAIDAIVFNGWVNSVNKATGQYENTCIMSLQASKDAFANINLSMVDPKACFRQLKGIGSSKLHGISAIAPIMKIDREDTRFVAAYGVAEHLDEGYNLAAMDWQDFENLIREIFEKEFAVNGGEVKVTQASRDGGVDAIAFDPDPIRGGKIVIQAKRYTNVVGVSAVRDLFGTTVNEGATKGILVTTANFGPDAYEFAKGKPLTLLDGGNLLHLLEKHGYKARINIREAKIILAEN